MAHILIAEELRELLAHLDRPAGYDVEWLPRNDPTPGGPYEAVVPLLSRRMGEAEMDRLPRLKIIANCAVGFDNVDVDGARRRGVVVTNTPDVLTESTADLTWALILAVARRLKEGLAMIDGRRWVGWHPTQLLGLELAERTLGIVGAGRIGRAVGRRAKGFGMHLLYWDRAPRPDLEEEGRARRVELAELLAKSDVITLHLPSTPDTTGLFDRRRLQTIKPGALLVNTARGDIVDEAGLLEALSSGRLAGAGLDVYPDEPRVHPDLVAHPRVVTLPHIGSATTATRRAMARLALDNALVVLGGGAPLTPVV
jgi:glyoxylate reductase